MNRVEFHYNISNKAHYLQRLLRKVLERGLTALVLCPTDELAAINDRLWSDDPASFLPHCLMTAPQWTLAATPIWLSDAMAVSHDRQVLVNCGATIAGPVGPVQRWLELVSIDPADAKAGRARWRHYQSQGLTIEPHDRAGRGA